MLDQISSLYPTRIAIIEMHIRSGYPLYCAEARNKMSMYPPPYYYNGQWYYVTPYMWYDGKKGGTNYYNWQYLLEQRMGITSDLNFEFSGWYNQNNRNGYIELNIINESSNPITGRLQFVIVEDSIYYSAPNGDLWHNHVARDYLPDPNGEVITVPARGSISRSRNFTIASDWNSDKCKIIAFLQSDNLQPDSTKEIYQGGMIKIREMTAVNEITNPSPKITTISNMEKTKIKLVGEKKGEFTLQIFATDGKIIQTIKDFFVGKEKEISLNLKTKGIYFYKLNFSGKEYQGKIINL
ncbi:MAG: Omp28-related outer membrane protein [candidate division WOR-3 bacterium]|nr:Omp28-related outer membrane protein [candidate division WOR-3 bacterium]MCX7837060.1 Omp28-related outer membrane protein [candidate division WOR-3 bacterium]MDW8114232.1 Omp28-related outer membrane protein [candidate division WOR-3 bacterium]